MRSLSPFVGVVVVFQVPLPPRPARPRLPPGRCTVYSRAASTKDGDQPQTQWDLPSGMGGRRGGHVSSLASSVDGGATPLFMAAQHGHEAVVRFLVAEGNAAVDQAENGGATPLFIAAQQGHEAVVRFLVAEERSRRPRHQRRRHSALHRGAAGPRGRGAVPGRRGQRRRRPHSAESGACLLGRAKACRRRNVLIGGTSAFPARNIQMSSPGGRFATAPCHPVQYKPRTTPPHRRCCL